MKKIIMLVSCIILSACSAPKSYMMQPEFSETANRVKKIGVTVPKATVMELGFGGSKTLDEEASQAALKVIEQGVLEGLQKSGMEAKLLEQQNDLLIFQKGYQPLSREMRAHFPGARRVPTVPSRIENFSEVLKNNNVDCVLAIEGLEHVSSAGRKAAQVVTAVLFGATSRGMTYLNYNLFCGADGKPMFTDLRAGSHFSISSSSDVSGLVNDITEKMFKVAKKKE